MSQAVRAIVIRDDKLLVMHRNKFGHEYYTLVGGGVDIGETLEQSLMREISEETSIQVDNPRLVFIQTSDGFYEQQNVFLCNYVAGEPNLSPESEEAKINKLGQNLYTPMWLPLQALPAVPFMSTKLQAALLDALNNGFPASPIEIQ